jgi:DNA repair protein SbcD/Mre11
MRFIHTADWHLGRTFHNVSLVEDQAHVLDQVVALVKETKADALVVAGDVYDRAVPPTDAVRLLGDVLERVVVGLEVPVLMIAGNHDSPDRLEFGAPLLSSRGLHVRGTLAPDAGTVVLHDEHGPVDFFLLPYAEPPLVRDRLGNDGLRSHHEAMRALTARILGAPTSGPEQHRSQQEPVGLLPGNGPQHQPDAPAPTDPRSNPPRSVLLAHCFAAGGEASESERPLTVGGAGTVDPDCFRAFSYTALGHLHRPQAFGARVRYSGSLLKYSFSEADHRKSVSVVELDASGNVTVEEIPLSPRRDVRIVEGFLKELLGEASREPGAKEEGPAGTPERAGAGDSASRSSPHDYLLVRLLDKEAILDPMGKLRQVFPNALHVERPGLWSTGEVQVAGRERLKASVMDLFAAFFQEMTDDPLDDGQRAAFAEIVEEMDREEREAGPIQGQAQGRVPGQEPDPDVPRGRS